MEFRALNSCNWPYVCRGNRALLVALMGSSVLLECILPCVSSRESGSYFLVDRNSGHSVLQKFRLVTAYAAGNM